MLGKSKEPVRQGAEPNPESLKHKLETPPEPYKADEIVMPMEIGELQTIETREINLVENARQGGILPAFLAESEYELPPGYGETTIVLQVRDPYWIHAYWEITEQKKNEIKQMLGPAGWEESHRTLRVHDITDIAFNGTNSHYSFDIHVNDHANNWYINVDRPNRSYCVDLGITTRDGNFILLSRSNSVRTPRDGVSEVIDEAWMTIDLLERAYRPTPGRGPASPEFVEKFAERIEKEVGSLGVSSISSPGFAVKREKGFWLVADTELIVYGATEPDARVTIQRVPVNVRKDGSFSARFALPDGEQVIEIEARSADGQMMRKITPVVRRHTKH